MTVCMTVAISFVLVPLDVIVPYLYFIPGLDAALVTFSDIVGNPKPNITCASASNSYADEGNFSISPRGHVTIANPQSADVGIYSCNVSNGLGSNSIEFKLTEAGIHFWMCN